MEHNVLSSLYVCMAIKYIIVLFVETPRKFITAVINLRGVSTNKTIIYNLFCSTFKIIAGHFNYIVMMKRSNTLKGINPVGRGGRVASASLFGHSLYIVYNKLRPLPGFVPPPYTFF
jgi:hypothetical protein